MAFKMKKSPIMRKVKDFTSPIDMRSPVKNDDEKERLDETYMTEEEKRLKRLLEIKRQRALLNKEEEFNDEQDETAVGTYGVDNIDVVGGGVPGGWGDFYEQAKKLITLDYDEEPVNK